MIIVILFCFMPTDGISQGMDTTRLKISNNDFSISNLAIHTINEVIKIAFPPIPTSLYHYEPYLTLSGSNYTDIASNSSLQLTKFSVAIWFRTNMDVPFVSEAYVVNKGGIGSNSPGQNMNYGIWMTDSGIIRGGFENSSGDKITLRSERSYNLYDWHYVVITYDGLVIRLYIDGELVASKYTYYAIPDNTGTQPIRIGANSYQLLEIPNGLFIGNVDELRIWNRALSASEIPNAYNKGVFNTNGQVLYLPF
jgi:hypothetical protein